MTRFESRPARCEDARAIATLVHELGYPTTPEEVAHRLASLLGTSSDAVFVALDDWGRVVGWIHALVARRVESEPFVEIGGLVVSARHRRLGIGRLLVDRAAEWALEKRVPRLRVRTRVEREDAPAFYLSAGFRETKKQRVLERRVQPPH